MFDALLVVPPDDEEMVSSARMAILEPDGEGIRAFIFVGNSTGGASQGDVVLPSFDGIGIL